MSGIIIPSKEAEAHARMLIDKGYVPYTTDEDTLAIKVQVAWDEEKANKEQTDEL